MAEIGATFGSIPGGAAVLCLAHDCLIEEPGATEGLVRTGILLSAASSFITLRRSIRAAAVGKNVPPESVHEQHEEEGSSVESGSVRCGGPCSSSTTIATACVVANAEVAAELDVYGKELCTDLAGIFNSSSSHSTPGGGTGVRGCVSTPQFQHIQQPSKTCRIRWAVKKHSAVLSPQSVCALTALLSAKGKEWADRSHSQNSNKHYDSAVRGGCSSGIHGRHDRYGDGDNSSPAGDPTAWKAALTDALLAVRTASLEHLALWVDACDPGKLDSACIADVLTAEAATLAPSEVGNGQVGAGTAEAKAGTAVYVGGDKKVAAAADGLIGHGEEATWAALHKASGLGLSPLMVLATTMSDDHNHCCSGVAPLPASLPFYGAGDVVDRETGAADQNPVDLDDSDADGSISGSRESSAVIALTRTAVVQALRLLSSTSLKIVARQLSPSPRSRGANSSNLESGKVEILPDISGHPAIGDLSCLDDDTLRGGAEGMIMALDAQGTGALPPAVLAVALQSGEAGFRLEPLQAQVVLRLAGGVLYAVRGGGSCCLLTSS